ncbi:hypothetical protein [Kitasatospora brasiliensis]|uniref:hypothetical protein n=1 Tax=Kitasatospora brasiliensis TaxID=3058040 RepID=UPI003D773DFE
MEQAASDLEKNHQRQRELAEELRMLKQEESLLADILSLAEHYERPADQALPRQRQSAAAETDTTKAGAKGTSHRPLLGDLLAELLGRHEEPCPAKELRDELMAAYPKRNPTPQVVRNTLESLVAKGRIRRHKQQRSVMYTLIRPGATASGQAG